MKEKLSLTEGNVYKTLLVFAVPFMLAQFLQALYGAVDLMVVGQFAATADVSAVATGSQIMYLASFVVLGFASAVTVLMGQYFGAGQEKRLSVLLAFFRRPIVAFMNTPAEAVEPALATSAAQGISFLFSLIYLGKRGLGFPFSVKDIGLHWDQIGNIIKIGIPIVVQNSLTEMSFLLITMIINGMGLVVSAAVGVVGKLVGFLFIPTIGMSMAVSAMCAQNYGAGKLDRARDCMKGGILFSFTLAVVAAVCSWLFGGPMTSLFTSDPKVVSQAALYLKTYYLDCVLVAIVFNMNGYFNGFGQTFFTMAHSLAATFLGRVPLTFLFSRMPGVTLFEMGLAVPGSTLISVFLCIWYLQRMKKADKKEKRGMRVGQNAEFCGRKL